MIRLWKILKQIILTGTLARITYYNVDGLLLKKYRAGKIVTVYLAGKVVFNNTLSNDAFGPWWDAFKEMYKGHEFKKLSRRKGMKIEEGLSVEKVKEIMRKQRIR